MDSGPEGGGDLGGWAGGWEREGMWGHMVEEAEGLRGSGSLGPKGEGAQESSVTGWETEEEGTRLDPPVIWKQCSLVSVGEGRNWDYLMVTAGVGLPWGSQRFGLSAGEGMALEQVKCV